MRIIRPVSAGRILLLFLAISLCCGCNKCGTGTYDDLPALMEALLQAYRPVATGDTIAVWAYPDASDVTGTIRVGVVAYGRSGIGSVYFSTDDGAVTAVSDETVNPDTGEYEFVYTIDTTALADGVHTIGAAVGLKTLDPITIYAANGASSGTWYVSTSGNDDTGDGTLGNPWRSLGRALGTEDTTYMLAHAAGGDTVLLRTGIYDLPEGARGDFTRYVAIKPYNFESVGMRGGILRSTFMKFEDINFGFIGGGGVTMYGHHLWFKGCEYTGAGKIYPDTINSDEAFRSREVIYGTTTFAHDVIIEECTVHDANQGISLIGSGKYIIRQCTVYDQNGDGIKFQGNNVLITGNTIHHVIPPVAWSVSQTGPSYNCAGVTLAFHISEDSGATYNTVSVPLSGAAQTSAQVAAQLNANADFNGAGLSADVSASPYPYAGNLRITQVDHLETYRFYITGGGIILVFRDNTTDNNLLSPTHPAYHTSDHCDYIANDAMDARNIVIRNNLMYGGESQGLKLDGIGSSQRRHFFKRDIAIINNCFAGTDRSGRLIYMNYRGSGSTSPVDLRSILHYEGIVIAHNTIYKPATGNVRAELTMDLENPNIANMLIKNNIIGEYYTGDWWIDSSRIGAMDYNCYTGTTYSAAGAERNVHSIIGNPLFVNTMIYDYNLQAGSPAKGEATPSLAIPYDIGWNPRNAILPSIGCYE